MQKKQAPSTQAIITAGEAVAVKVYRAFFGKEKYTVKLAFAAGHKMAEFKKIARPFYAHMDEVQMLHTLAAYSEQDILDAFSAHSIKEDTCKENQPNAIGKLLAPSTETGNRRNP